MTGFAIYQTKFGNFKIGYEHETIVLIQPITEKSVSDVGIPTSLTDHVILQISEYFDGKRTEFDIPYTLHGTDFQQRVWRALLDIPYGEIRSYRDIAIAIGNKNASRAVGMANNKNPILIVVPCHRVVGSNGKLVGYAGGLEMKSNLLMLERAQRLSE